MFHLKRFQEKRKTASLFFNLRFKPEIFRQSPLTNYHLREVSLQEVDQLRSDGSNYKLIDNDYQYH